VAVEAGLYALVARELMGSLHLGIADSLSGQIAIGCGLVSLRGALVDVSLMLVAIGRALIGIRRGLVLVCRGLIGRGRRLIGLLPSSIPTPADDPFLSPNRTERGLASDPSARE
jgi:hypothetical protein